MANVTANVENAAKTTLWQSNESSYLNIDQCSAVIIMKKSIETNSSGEVGVCEQSVRRKFQDRQKGRPTHLHTC